MLLGFALVLCAGLAFFVAAPLLVAERAGEATLPIDVTPLADLKRRRLVVYENLKDLDFEFQAGENSPSELPSPRGKLPGGTPPPQIPSQPEKPTASGQGLTKPGHPG